MNNWAAGPGAIFGVMNFLCECVTVIICSPWLYRDYVGILGSLCKYDSIEFWCWDETCWQCWRRLTWQTWKGGWRELVGGFNCFSFQPYWYMGKSSNLNIFAKGWLNHQLSEPFVEGMLREFDEETRHRSYRIMSNLHRAPATFCMSGWTESTSTGW